MRRCSRRERSERPDRRTQKINGGSGDADRRTGRRRGDDTGPQGQNDARRRRRAPEGQDQFAHPAGPEEAAAQPRRGALHRQRRPRRDRADLHHRQPAGRQAEAAQSHEADSGSAGDHEAAHGVRDLRDRAGRDRQLQRIGVAGPPPRGRSRPRARMARTPLPDIIEPTRPPAAVDAARSTSLVAGLVTSLRPSQWTKNLFVFAGLMFGQRLLELPAVLAAGAAFVLFCLLSGVVYLLNDVADRDADRQHPIKRLRPIASGAVPVSAALTAAGAIGLSALIGAFALRPLFGLLALLYVALLALYSLRLKHVVILDVLTIAAGFLVRVAAGAVAVSVAVSVWLYMLMIL